MLPRSLDCVVVGAGEEPGRRAVPYCKRRTPRRGRSDQRGATRCSTASREHLRSARTATSRAPRRGPAPQSPKTIHWEFYDFYAYLNQWWITAGVERSGLDLVRRATSGSLKHWHTGRRLRAPVPLGAEGARSASESRDIGFTLRFGAPAEAERIGRASSRWSPAQPASPTKTIIASTKLELLTSFAPDDPGVKLAAIVDGTKPDQCWWSLGGPVAFLAHLHLHTGDPEVPRHRREDPRGCRPLRRRRAQQIVATR